MSLCLSYARRGQRSPPTLARCRSLETPKLRPVKHFTSSTADAREVPQVDSGQSTGRTNGATNGRLCDIRGPNTTQQRSNRTQEDISVCSPTCRRSIRAFVSAGGLKKTKHETKQCAEEETLGQNHPRCRPGSAEPSERCAPAPQEDEEGAVGGPHEPL